MVDKIRHLDLFSGIGGFSLGLERTGRFETVQFCEIDPYCRKVLRKHWPEVPIENDLDDWISMSDPKRGGATTGELAAPAHARPDWILVENTGHRWRAWVPELRCALHGLGYASLPLRVRASDLGAPHRRSRVFLIANADSERLRQLSRWWCGKGRKVAQELNLHGHHSPGPVGEDDGVSGRLDRHRRRMLGNAIVPQIAELIGHAICATSDDIAA